MKIQLKRLGKKKVKTLDYKIDITPKTLEELIVACVKAEVDTYNQKRENIQLVSFLSPKEIQQQSQDGKIGFGDLANTTLAIEQEAIGNALLGFKDGLFLVFVDEEEVKTLDSQLKLTESSTIAFLRMTFLTGTYW